MSSVYPIKETVKVITITQPLQKINFQIRHPENVFALTGIAVTSNLIGRSRDDKSYNGSISGNLSLAISQKGDVAFGEDVMTDDNDYADITEKSFNGLTASILSAKKRQFYFETFYKINKALLEGFYEDVYAPRSGEGREPLPYLYKIRIYLRYQVSDTIKHSSNP